LVDQLSSLIYRRNARLRDAHAPKGIVAPAGLLNRLAPLVQERVPVPLIRIGRLYLIAIPGEPTIVSGLRLRRTVATIVGAKLQDVLCVGYSNAYMHYVTTPEEYDEQRYEGGSTLFGRWELPALMQVAADLAIAMRNRTPIAAGEHPGPADTSTWLRLLGDDAGDFGRVTVEPRVQYKAGDVAHAGFVSANPNHDLRRGGTYLEVQRREGGEWVRIADDGDWATTFRWRRAARKGPKSAESTATITWRVPEGTPSGDYRIVHHGTARTTDGLVPFTGTTREFRVA
jgi:neutral ceramidase